MLYTDHIDGRGVDPFRLTCENDLEGIVGKWKHGPYVCGDEQPPDRRLASTATLQARRRV